MGNKEITMYELIGLIKDGKAPKKIKYNGKEYYYNFGDYYSVKDINLFNNVELKLKSIRELLQVKVEILPEKNEMKEMVYQSKRKTEVLYHGFYKDYEFYILNLGTHPTAYVNVCNNRLLNGKSYNNIDIDVHGGLTYSENELYINDEKEKVNGWFIGWDYSHCYDYVDYEINMPENIMSNGKKWTTEEIFEDVKSVIEQCINCKLKLEINDNIFSSKKEAIDYVNNYFSSDENDEWEDIGKISFITTETQKEKNRLMKYTINQLIKNQKYLKERLDKYDRKD